MLCMNITMLVTKGIYNPRRQERLTNDRARKALSESTLETGLQHHYALLVSYPHGLSQGDHPRG